MTKGEAIRYMNSHPEVILERDNSGKGFICPFCGSGTGDKGTGITAKEGCDGYPKLRCWACDEVGEVGADGTIHAISAIDLAAKMRGVNPSNTKAAIVAACDLFGISYNELDNDAGYSKRSNTSGAMQTAAKSPSTRPAQSQPTPPASAATSGTAKKDEKPKTPLYTKKQFDAMHEAALADTYLAQRGISAETVARHPIGIDEHFVTGSADGHPARWKTIVFALDKYSAEYRNTDASAAKGDRYRKKGPARLWNLDAIRDGEPVFVTEGIIDALSIDEVGGDCIGLGSASNVDMLLAELRARSNDAKRGALPNAIIEVLDNDDTGRAAALKLRDGIKGIGGILYFDGRAVMGTSKDPNDALLAERDAFAQRVEAMKQKPLEKYMHDNAASYAISDFWKYVMKTKVFSTTGFLELDEILGGGLFAGSLYFVGAISSLGKTTFCLELADNVAKSGVDVLYFSLEMSKFELMAKSVSRLTHRHPASTSGKKNLAKTTRGILTGGFHDHYTQEEQGIIAESLNAYAVDIGEHMFIFDGLGSIGTKEIAKAVRAHKRMTGRTPLVVIDYVQILKAQDERATDQRNIDMNVVALKNLAVAEELPVIGISSFNRENYTAPVNMTAFKQSGGIEYSSDVLIGLQYYGMDEPKRNADGEESAATESEQAGKARRQKVVNKWNKVKEKGIDAVVPIELKVLKNRNGKLGTQLFYFWPAVNDIKEVSVMFGGNEVERDDELTPDHEAKASSFFDKLDGNKVKIGRARTEAAQEKRRFDVFATPTLTSLEVASMRKSYREFCERHPHGEELVAEWAKRQKITDLAKMTGGQYKDLLAYFERIDAIAIMYGRTDDDSGDPNAAKMQTLLESGRDAQNQQELEDLFDGAAGTTDKGKTSSYTSATPPAQDTDESF